MRRKAELTVCVAAHSNTAKFVGRRKEISADKFHQEILVKHEPSSGLGRMRGIGRSSANRMSDFAPNAVAKGMYTLE